MTQFLGALHWGKAKKLPTSFPSLKATGSTLFLLPATPKGFSETDVWDRCNCRLNILLPSTIDGSHNFPYIFGLPALWEESWNTSKHRKGLVSAVQLRHLDLHEERGHSVASSTPQSISPIYWNFLKPSVQLQLSPPITFWTGEILWGEILGLQVGEPAG